MSNSHMTSYTLTVLVHSEGAADWWMTGVYGPLEANDKAGFLQELVDVCDLHVGPWLLAGDFNLITREEDKNKSRVNRGMIVLFRAKLNRLELKELYLNGRRYTWSNER